jgi:hypothetical protein
MEEKNNIKSYKVCGETGVCDLMMATEWKLNLSKIIEGYELSNIFNADETGFFFFKAMPDKTLSEKGIKCKGGKLAKERITIMLTCSAVGEKLPPLIIGKAKKPRCFSKADVFEYGINYTNSSKAWMTTTIFNKYLVYLNEHFRMNNRKIFLFIDNARYMSLMNQPF